MAKRKNWISIDMYAFADYADKLDKLGADLKKTLGKAMKKGAAKVEKDVLEALDDGNLPAGGKYQRNPSKTKASVIKDAEVKWSGNYGEIGVGFDKSEPGAGGWLITGTPKMQPDKKLAQIFQSKKYAKTINDEIKEELEDQLKKLGG